MCARLDRRCVVALLTMLIVGVCASTARAGVAPEACCRPSQPCIDLPPEMCTGYSLGVGTTCAADAAKCVPAAGAWGLTVMALLLLTAATLVMRARRSGLPNLRTVVVLLALAAPAASTTFAAPPAAKVENVHNVTDGQRTIRIIAAPIRVASGKPSLTERVLGRRPVPIDNGVAQGLPAADQPDPDADDGVWPTSFGGGGDDDREHNAARMSSTPPGPKDLGHPTNAEDDAPDAGEGGVAATIVGGQIQVLGMELHYGANGPVVPVRLDSKLQADPDFVPRFGGADLQVYDANNPSGCSSNTPSTCVGIETVALGTSTGSLVFRARAAFDPDNADHDNNPWTGADFHREVVSDSANSLVLIDRDNINDLIAQKGIHLLYGNQIPIKDIIAPYVDSAGNVYLDPNRILILFELGTTNVNSSAYDFQDLVIALDLDGVVQAPDYVFPDTATSAPDNGLPYSQFDWSMVRAAPGGTRIKGLAYQRYTLTVTFDDIFELKACIAATGTNPLWTNCTLRTVYSTINAGFGGHTVDMALNDDGFHSIGFLDYDSSTGLTKYLVSFTKDNGQTWDVAPREIGHYTAITADDIDLASNDAGSIGVLVYYRLSGTPTPNPADLYGAVTDSLVLYTYNMNVDPTLNNPKKTAIVTGTGAQYGSGGCNGACFGLTGDANDTFHAFYYQGGIAKVTSVSNASTSPSTIVRTIANNGAASIISAGRTIGGAAACLGGGTAIGTYDVPTSGNIVFRGTSAMTGINQAPYTMILTRDRVDPPGAVTVVARITATGVGGNNTSISDALPYPTCTGGYVGPNCAQYVGDYQRGHGAGVIGNVLYASSLRQEYSWSTAVNPARYLESVERIVIHQTSAEQ